MGLFLCLHSSRLYPGREYSKRQKKCPHSTVSLPYLTVLLPYFNRTYALLPAYFRCTLIVLLPHLLMYCNRTTAVLSPYHETTIKDWWACSRIYMGTEDNAGERDAGLEKTTICELLPVEQ